MLYLRIIFSDRLTFNKPLVLADEFSQHDGDAMGCSKPAANPGAAQEPPLTVGDLSCCHHPPGQPVPFTGCGGWELVFLRCCRLWCSRTALHLIRMQSTGLKLEHSGGTEGCIRVVRASECIIQPQFRIAHAVGTD